MTTWHEIVVVGSEDAARGFVAGFLGGRDLAEAVVFGHDVHVQPASLGERLRELVGVASRHALLATEAVSAPLAAALRRSGESAGLRIDTESVVAGAAFDFAAEAFSRDVAAQIESALREALPEDVRVDAYKEVETTDRGSIGAELYSPSHAYTYRAKGSIAGALPGVLEMHRRAAESEFVKAEPITLERRPAAAR